MLFLVTLLICHWHYLLRFSFGTFISGIWSLVPACHEREFKSIGPEQNTCGDPAEASVSKRVNLKDFFPSVWCSDRTQCLYYWWKCYLLRKPWLGGRLAFLFYSFLFFESCIYHLCFLSFLTCSSYVIRLYFSTSSGWLYLSLF